MLTVRDPLSVAGDLFADRFGTLRAADDLATEDSMASQGWHWSRPANDPRGRDWRERELGDVEARHTHPMFKHGYVIDSPNYVPPVVGVGELTYRGQPVQHDATGALRVLDAATVGDIAGPSPEPWRLPVQWPGCCS